MGLALPQGDAFQCQPVKHVAFHSSWVDCELNVVFICMCVCGFGCVQVSRHCMGGSMGHVKATQYLTPIILASANKVNDYIFPLKFLYYSFITLLLV